MVGIWDLYSISESAPHITLLPACIRHITVSLIMGVDVLILKAVDYFVPFTSVSRFVLPS